MDRRQKKRILSFLLVPILAAILFLTDDLLVRIITLSLIIIYVAFIIFLRDSIRFDSSYSTKDYSDDDYTDNENPDYQPDIDESFKIISKNKNVEVITAENYKPDFISQKTTVKPPDLRERFEEIANESLPPNIGHDEQFSFALEKILAVMKEAYNAHSVVFFWYNKKKEKLSIDKFISNTKDIQKRKFELEDDILSKIVERAEPELLSDISPAAEADVIRYYTSPQGIRSFVGVPLFYDKNLIAILVMDAKEADAFGIETIYAMGRFVRVITMIIQIFEEKYADSISQQRLKGILNLLSPDSSFESESDVIESLQQSINSFISYDLFAFVYYDPIQQKFITLKVVNKTSLKYIGENLEIELNGTLAGKSITSGVPVKIDDTSEGNYKRYSKSEDVSFDGSFLAVPLVHNGQNYGVICFESLKKNAYSNSDAQFLNNALNIISFIIYTHSTQKLLKNLISVDIETRALNSETFKERLSADLIKAEQLNAPGALALIRIDDFLEQESLFDGNPLPRVLTTVSEIIAKEMTPMNLFGRLGERLFAVYFFNSTTKEVFIWAEKLRVKIARKPIAVVSKQSSYTVSIGVASSSKKIDVDEVIYNADLALQKALEKGGNTVRNIN